LVVVIFGGVTTNKQEAQLLLERRWSYGIVWNPCRMHKNWTWLYPTWKFLRFACSQH